MKKHYYSRIFNAFLPKPSFLRLRSITKVFGKRKLFWSKIHMLVKIFLLTHLFFSFLFLLFFIHELNVVHQAFVEKREEARQSLSYWVTIANIHPNYPDAFYQGAWYAYVLGQKQRALTLLTKAIALDPDFMDAKKLQTRLLSEKTENH